MTPPYRILFLDLDGTVVDQTGQISARVLAALERARAAGCAVVVCTGRSRRSAARPLAQVAAAGYGIVLNGAEVVHWDTGEIVRRADLSLDAARTAIAASHRLGVAPVCLGLRDDARDLLTDRRAPLFPYYGTINADRLAYVDDLEHDLTIGPPSITAYHDRERTGPVADAWARELAGLAAVFHGPTHFYRCWYAQLNAADADKSLAAAFVADRLGVPREQTMAIGDHVNDLKLLRWAGLGVCMGDGDEEARACADYVAPPLADDGAAQVIERFVLGERS